MGGKKHEEHENHERWIIPYADMVTLLLAFFVVLYAMSNSDKKKMEAVAESVAQAFIGGDKGGASQRSMVNFDDQSRTPPQTSPRFMVRRVVTNEEIIDELRRMLDQEGFDLVHQSDLQPIRIKITSRGVAISISAGFLFKEGSTEINPDQLPIIDIVADLIRSTPRYIEVEGHTDQRPVVGNTFYDNLQLSILRAASMTRVLSQQFGVDPKRIRTAGWGQYRPVADNSTEAGREQNRRVEIIMLNVTDADQFLEDETVPR